MSSQAVTLISSFKPNQILDTGHVIDDGFPSWRNQYLFLCLWTQDASLGAGSLGTLQCPWSL
jgi:hypothetical protein